MTSRILRVVGEVSSTMTFNCRVTLVPPSCLLSAVVCSLHSHDSMPPSCAPHGRSPGQSAHSRCTHDVRWIQEWPRAPPMTVPRGAGEVAPFRSLEVQEEKASDRKKKLVTGRNCTLARGESRRFVSRTAHEESRLPHSGARGFCYNRWMGWRMASIAVTDPLNKPKEVEKGDAQAMRSTVEHDSKEHPLMRVITLGEFALERLVPTPSRTQDEPRRYTRVARSEWSNRGPAMALLKVLLCQVNRRASRDELIEAIWPNHEAINATHALDSAASVLRRHILRTSEVGNLLLTLRSGGGTTFKPPGPHRPCADTDAMLSPTSEATTVQVHAPNPM